MLSEQALQKIAIEVAKYPAEQKQSAVMSALRIAQVVVHHGQLLERKPAVRRRPAKPADQI